MGRPAGIACHCPGIGQSIPLDPREWVPADDLVHFVIEAVNPMQLPSLAVNRRGTGGEQYPPRMMLALLVYCYSMGVFSSRRIERATYRDIPVRYLTGDTYPDHDKIRAFRRKNGLVVNQAFVEGLRLASEMKLLKVGTVSVDGPYIRANASKHKSIRYDRAGELERQLRADGEELLKKAERQDQQDDVDGQYLPEEIARWERLPKTPGQHGRGSSPGSMRLIPWFGSGLRELNSLPRTSPNSVCASLTPALRNSASPRAPGPLRHVPALRLLPSLPPDPRVSPQNYARCLRYCLQATPTAKLTRPKLHKTDYHLSWLSDPLDVPLFLHSAFSPGQSPGVRHIHPDL